MTRCDRYVSVITQYGRRSLRQDLDEAIYEDRPGWVGVADVPKPVSTPEGWVDHPTDRRAIFGECDQFGYLTQRCYEVDHLIDMAQRRWGPEIDGWIGFLATTILHRWHYLDAGGNGRPIRIEYPELGRALHLLGLWVPPMPTIEQLRERWVGRCVRTERLLTEQEFPQWQGGPGVEWTPDFLWGGEGTVTGFEERYGRICVQVDWGMEWPVDELTHIQEVPEEGWSRS